MKKLSVGLDSTLGNWIILSKLFFGEDTKPTIFLKEKADLCEKGLDEEVIADEGQLLYALGQMFIEEMETK